jgi:two-component system LytT family response regulator
MPDIDGFDVLEAVGPENMPVVIFATAYDQYAVQAFDVHALDYLLKPFDEERFRRTLERARQHLERTREAPERTLRALLASLQERRKYLQRLVVKSGGRIFFLKVADIDWFEASGNYVTLHVGRSSHLVRGTMTTLEGRLDPDRFLRVRRSAIVNLERVKELQPWFKGEQVLVLTDGTRLTVGRAFRDRLERLLEKAAP